MPVMKEEKIFRDDEEWIDARCKMEDKLDRALEKFEDIEALRGKAFLGDSGCHQGSHH